MNDGNSKDYVITAPESVIDQFDKQSKADKKEIAQLKEKIVEMQGSLDWHTSNAKQLEKEVENAHKQVSKCKHEYNLLWDPNKAEGEGHRVTFEH